MKELKHMEGTKDSEYELMVNEILQVQLPADINPGNYYSRIDDIVEKKLILTWPTDKGIRLPVHSDQILSFSMVRNDSAYSFSGLVDKTATEPLPMVIIIVSSNVERIQRRQDFRVKCLIPLEIDISFPENSDGSPSEVLHMKTATYDLSASGVSLRILRMIPEGTLSEVKISLPDGGTPIETSCRVVHCFAPPENPNKYHIGIQFLEIEENNKARIVRYIYRIQLKRIRD